MKQKKMSPFCNFFLKLSWIKVAFLDAYMQAMYSCSLLISSAIFTSLQQVSPNFHVELPGNAGDTALTSRDVKETGEITEFAGSIY